jgi:hypothetical protein
MDPIAPSCGKLASGNKCCTVQTPILQSTLYTHARVTSQQHQHQLVHQDKLKEGKKKGKQNLEHG